MSKLRRKTATGKRAGSRAKSKAARAAVKSKPKARARKPTAPAAPRSPNRDPLDQLIEGAALALALPVEPAWRPMVKANLEVTLRLAKLFDAFPLPDDAEPAPVFVA